jgi:hypothetical protein
VRRAVALLLGLGAMLAPVAGPMPAAQATGAGACTITGTIAFAPSAARATEGAWTIEGIINCNGLYNGYRRFNGPGTFAGSGTYKALEAGSGPCLGHDGSGTVDYRFPTTGDDIHLIEPQDYTLVGAAGTFATPSLRGAFQITPPWEGDCVTAPLTKALFVAEATLVRFYPPDPHRYLPPKQRS